MAAELLINALQAIWQSLSTMDVPAASFYIPITRVDESYHKEYNQ
jgi:hypothetical protein